MSLLHFLNCHKPTCLLLVVFLTVNCQDSIYKKTYLKEMRKTQRLDSLLFDISFGNKKDDYLDKLWMLNKEKKIKPASETYGWVSYDLKVQPESVSPSDIEFRFIGNFNQTSNLNRINMKFTFKGWAPWNQQYQSHVLIDQILDSILNWYGGNSFFRFDQVNDTLPAYFKIDANRQFKIFIDDDQFVGGEITDLKSKTPQ